MSFPNKEGRTKCWNHRDEYWKCLDDGKTDTECKKFREQYEKFCPALWVSFMAIPVSISVAVTYDYRQNNSMFSTYISLMKSLFVSFFLLGETL